MTNHANAPLVLDLDGSVGPLPGATVVPLAQWQETVRFGCRMADFRRFEDALASALPAKHGTVFFGSGDFHHLTWPLVARLQAPRSIQVVVLDNHPDNMRFPFGIHCGSWVRRVAALDFVQHVHVVGITSGDIGLTHSWENHWMPLLRGKLTYWSMDVDVAWAHRLGFAHAFRSFDSPEELVATFSREQSNVSLRTYLSIDKDVFHPEVARTNWDQGRFRLQHALTLIDALPDDWVGSDINGEISSYRYRSWFKRRLSALDAQPEVDASELANWQAQQHELNLSLLAAMSAKTDQTASR